MDNHLTLHTVIVGSLGFCLGLLATAWVLGRLARPQNPPRRGIDRDDNDPRGNRYRPIEREDRHVSEVCLVGESDECRSSGADSHRARWGDSRRSPQRVAS